jgi:hypothetical protein
MEMLTTLRRARDQGQVLEIDLIDGTEHHGCWVEKVGRTFVHIGQGDGSEPTFTVAIDDIKEVRVVS